MNWHKSWIVDKFHQNNKPYNEKNIFYTWKAFVMNKKALGVFLEAYAEGAIIAGTAVLLVGMILKNKG